VKTAYARSNRESLGNRVVSPEEEKERLQWEDLQKRKVLSVEWERECVLPCIAIAEFSDDCKIEKFWLFVQPALLTWHQVISVYRLNSALFPTDNKQ